MKITSFRRGGRGGGRRVGTFCVDVESISLKNLTLIKKPDGELRVFGADIEAFFNSLANAALAHAEVQHD